MTDNRLLTAAEIEEVWKQLSMKLLSNSLFRFAGEIAMKQADISFKAGIREVVEWIEKYAIHGGDVPLKVVLADMEVHSPYKPTSPKKGER